MRNYQLFAKRNCLGTHGITIDLRYLGHVSGELQTQFGDDLAKLFDHVTDLVTRVVDSTVPELITCLSTALETGHFYKSIHHIRT